jgi:hypothetical protein
LGKKYRKVENREIEKAKKEERERVKDGRK